MLYKGVALEKVIFEPIANLTVRENGFQIHNQYDKQVVCFTHPAWTKIEAMNSYLFELRVDTLVARPGICWS